MDSTHELGVCHTVLTGSSVDTGNPQGTEPNAVFKIRGTKKDFERIVALLKESGVADTVTFELDKS